MKVGVPFLSRPEGRATVVIGLVLLAAMLGWLALRWWRAKSQLESPKVQRIHALGTMAGGIAHEFNNYLLAISGFTELARDELADDSPARPHLDEVLAASSRAKTLIEQILSYSTTKDSELVPIDARGAVKEGLRLLSAVMPATVQIVEVLIAMRLSCTTNTIGSLRSFAKHTASKKSPCRAAASPSEA